MMKRLFPLLATMAVLLPLLFFNVNASPPDSCLKMQLPNDYHEEWNVEMNRYKWVGSINRDSVKIDSCVDSPTFGMKFGIRYFILDFNVYPFDSLLKITDKISVNNIPNKITGLKGELEQLQQEFGTFYFMKEYSLGMETDSSLWHHGRVVLIFDDYQIIDTVLTKFKNQISSLKEILFDAQVFTPLSNVNEDIFNENELIIFPNPTQKSIKINYKDFNNYPNIEIYNYLGIKIKEFPFSLEIDISDLSNGLYFVKYGNQTGKFIKE